MPKANTDHINLPFWENLMPCSAEDDKQNSYSMAYRLQEVALSKTKHFAGQVGTELERWSSIPVPSIIDGSAMDQEILEHKLCKSQN